MCIGAVNIYLTEFLLQRNMQILLKMLMYFVYLQGEGSPGNWCLRWKMAICLK